MFGKIRVLRMQLDGNIREEELLLEEIGTYLGQVPIMSIPIGGGLYLFYAEHSNSSERVTRIYNAVGKITAEVCGNTLIGRLNRNGYAHICAGDVAIARWLVRRS